MADISQVKLPDGTTYNLKDSYVRTNYRALNNNDFDTINVTELNAGDLIVTGAARFLNTINGSISGNAVTATKATQDGSGNTITSTYLPLSGGTMTGQIVLASSALKTNESAGWTMNQYGNLVHQRATTTDYWAIANNAGTYKFQVYYETGAVTATGNVTAPKFIGALQGNADTATTARKVVNDTARRTDPNTAYYDAGLRYYLVSSSMTTDKPSLGDGKILDMQWDNNGGWASQLFITNSNSNVTTGTRAMLRSQYQTSWKSWIPMAVFNETTPTSGRVVVTDGTDGGVKSSAYTIAKSVPSNADFNDTKNTAGSTDTSSKIFLIGATSQAANPQTYSQDTAYVGTDGCLYSGGTKVLTAHQDISGKVNKSGDTMSGALTVEASNSYSSYNEGIRINAGARTYATLLMGGTNGTTSGTNDGAFWIGVYNTGTTARRLMIAHNGSTNTGTYFYASSSSDISPSLRVGSNLQVANVISANVSNSGTAGGISLYSTDPASYGVAMRSTSNGGKHGYVQGDCGTYFYMAGATNRGWVFVNAGSGNRASISTEGNMVLNGSLTLGGNTTNTSGVRAQYNSTTKSLDFVFVA